jgi:uncharacterized protein YjbI with pentapeptide repeats
MASIVSIALRLGSEPAHHGPTGTLGKYVAAKPVVPQSEMAPLLALLRNGDVAAFNKLRTNAPYAGKRLDFRGLSLVGLSLAGVDLSNSILSDADLTGACLTNASFRGSYLATVRVAHNYPGAAPMRRTSFVNCDFTGAIVTSTEYFIHGEVFPYEPFDVWHKREVRFDLANANISGAVGLQPVSSKQK